VGGYLGISADAKLPELTSVGGYLDISADAKLPVLTSVGGSLGIRADAKLPVLTSVGGYLGISADGKLYAPHAKKEDSTAVQKCRAMLLSSFAAAGFSFADGVLARIVSTRGPVSRVIICGKTEVSYLVTDGEAFSHGKTLAEARDGLLFKIGKRDPSEFKAWTLDQVVTKRDAIRAYRVITGACEGGVRSWMESRQTPDSLTVKEIIGLTVGAYGADTFKGFFAAVAK
jgi:hypothetical protein